MTRLARVLVFAAVVVAGACTDDDKGSGAGLAGDVGVVELHRSGGFEGLDQSVRAQPDGSIEVRDQGETAFAATGDKMNATDLTRLRDIVGGREFADLDDTYIPDDLCCDQFEYKISADVDGDSVESATADGLTETPELLTEAIYLLLPYIP